MVQIIQENRRPSFSSRLGGGLSAGVGSLLQGHEQKQQMNRENEAAKRLGMDLSGIQDPELRRSLLVESLKGQNQTQENMFKHFNQLELEGVNKSNTLSNAKELENLKFTNLSELEKQKAGYDVELEDVKSKNKPIDKSVREEQQHKNQLQSGLKTVDEMRKLIKKGNLGLGSRFMSSFSDKTRKDRALYAQLGKSLISLASTIPIRNKAEFDTLAEQLYNPSNSDATNQGTLEAMERIIKQSMSLYDEPEQGPQDVPSHLKKPERPPLTSFIKG